MSSFSEQELARFHRDGYLCVPGLAPREVVARMRAIAEDHLRGLVEPVEYEADLGYPSAPVSREAPGGLTVRRLRQAHARGSVFTEWLQWPGVVGRLKQLLGPGLFCSLSHHNCVMTKQPEYSSLTGWHQDVRYWSFRRPELINVWLALGRETPDNGGLSVVPGSHALALGRHQFDEDLFFREDLPENRALLDKALPVLLDAGDVLFFHCRLLHSAGRNRTGETKCSVVFTYRAGDNPPVAGTKSTELPDMLLHG